MMTTDVESVFIDINVLVYANVAESPFHDVALTAIETHYAQGTELWISRQIMREFIATLTRPQAFVNPRSVSTVIERVRFFQNRFRVGEDGPQVTERLLALVDEIPTGGRQVHDSNIVATMLVYNIRHLLTHNVADFARFSEFIRVLPIVENP